MAPASDSDLQLLGEIEITQSEYIPTAQSETEQPSKKRAISLALQRENVERGGSRKR
jgi:hypothetical protein